MAQVKSNKDFITSVKREGNNREKKGGERRSEIDE